MSLAIKSLASGTLPSSKGTLYTCPALKSAIVRTITLVNTDPSTRTVNLYIKPSGGSSARIAPMNMALETGDLWVYDAVTTLEAGDIVEGDASLVSVVDYTISGVEG